MYFNKAIVIGNLTRDPELKSLPSGAKLTSFSLATNRVWRNPQGEKQEATDYHNIVVFGRQAETSAQFLKKGSMVMIEGRMQTRSWDGQDGSKRYRTEIVADRVQFGPRNSGGGGGNSSNDQTRTWRKDDEAQPAAAAPKQEVPTIEYPADEINPEDIPF